LREAAYGFDFARVLRALEEADAFVSGKGTKGERAVPKRTPDKRVAKFYYINPAKLSP
jgi:hypothetical protein